MSVCAFCQATLEPSSQGVRIKTDTWCTLMRAAHTPYASHLRAHAFSAMHSIANSRSPADLHISDVVFRPALSTKQRLPATSRLESRTILVGRLSKQARNCTPAATNRDRPPDHSCSRDSSRPCAGLLDPGQKAPDPVLPRYQHTS